MKNRTLAPILILAAAAVLPLSAADDPALPSVDQILTKYVTALGGKAAIEKVNSRVMKGTIEVTTYGVSGTLEQYSKLSGQQVTISQIEGYGSVIQCYDGKGAWISDPQQGLRDVTGAELAQFKRNADLLGPLHLREQFAKLTVKGKGKVGERDAYILEGAPAEGSPEQLYFDAQNGLLLRSDFKTPQDSSASVLLEDYKAVDGLQLPFTIKNDSAELAIVIHADEIQQNVPVDDAKFAKPAK